MKFTTVVNTFIVIVFNKIFRPGFDSTKPTVGDSNILKIDFNFPFKKIYVNGANSKYLYKSIQTKSYTIFTEQLECEHKFLKAFKQRPKLTVNGGSTILAQKFIVGKELKNFNQQTILTSFNKSLEILSQKWKHLDLNSKKSLPKKTDKLIALEFLMYIPLLAVKDFKKIRKLIFIIRSFYNNRLFGNISPTEYTIAHRDLTPENIIITDKGTTEIIDFEVARVANKFTDLSLFPRFYISYLDKKQILSFLDKKLTKSSDRFHFINLSIFYTIQFMVIEEKNSKYFKEAEMYIDWLYDEIIPRYLKNSVSLGEKLYFKSLDIIGRLVNKANFKDSNFILCYHSVDDSNWRFSTPPVEFKKQIAFLKKNFTVSNLDTILGSPRKKTCSVAITFDDGYEDVYTNAFPLMKNLGITGTVFLIGDKDNSNRGILNNNKNLLSNLQINDLKKHGWTFGYHTLTHSKLKGMSNSRLQKEVASKYNYFAYPNGYYDQTIIKAISKYKYALTVDGGKLSTNNHYKINRVPIEGAIKLEQFKVLLTPLGLRFSNYFMCVLKIKENYIVPIFKR